MTEDHVALGGTLDLAATRGTLALVLDIVRTIASIVIAVALIIIA